jgi:toxin FitB
MAKERPNKGVDTWFRATENEEMFLSVITLAELHQGLLLMPAGAKKRQLDEWLRHDLILQFEDRILPIGIEIAEAYAVLAARSRKAGFSPGALDTLIAATAMVHHLAVATLNRKDFQRFGVEMVEF